MVVCPFKKLALIFVVVSLPSAAPSFWLDDEPLGRDWKSTVDPMLRVMPFMVSDALPLEGR